MTDKFIPWVEKDRLEAEARRKVAEDIGLRWVNETRTVSKTTFFGGTKKTKKEEKVLQYFDKDLKTWKNVPLTYDRFASVNYDLD